MHFRVARTRRCSLAAGLKQPEGIAVRSEGAVYVVEVGAKRLVRIDPDSHAVSTVADKLPIGLTNGMSLFRSVAASATAIYINSDIENSIYKITRR